MLSLWTGTWHLGKPLAKEAVEVLAEAAPGGLTKPGDLGGQMNCMILELSWESIKACKGAYHHRRRNRAAQESVQAAYIRVLNEPAHLLQDCAWSLFLLQSVRIDFLNGEVGGMPQAFFRSSYERHDLRNSGLGKRAEIA